MYSDFMIGVLRAMDRTLAWKITAQNIFEPLYGDYSVVGRVMGFLFRSARLIVASVVYAVVFAVALAAYLAWLAFPAYLVFKTVS